jgi:diacylglycerol kinase (ATP)
MNASVFVIVNPAAGQGQSLQRASAFGACMVDGVVAGILHTREAGDEERLARRALEDGANVLVAVGGDGTCSGIANAVLKNGRACRLAVIPSGTGNDFAKTLGVEKKTPQQIAELVSSGASSEMDVGHADGRFFLNSCGFGFDASVLEASNRVRFLKGDAVYIYSALTQLFTYRGISVSADGAPDSLPRTLMVTVSNGQWLGGTFRIAPHASVTDGELDVGFFSDSNVFERAKLFAQAFRGTHLGMPSVKTSKVRSLTLNFSEPPEMEIDGELRRAKSASLTIECQSRALSVIAAPGYPL